MRRNVRPDRIGVLAAFETRVIAFASAASATSAASAVPSAHSAPGRELVDVVRLSWLLCSSEVQMSKVAKTATVNRHPQYTSQHSPTETGSNPSFFHGWLN